MKIQKYLHSLTGTIFQSKQLDLLNHGELSSCVSKAFINTKNSNYSLGEEAIFKSLNNYREELLKSNELISYEIFNSDQKRSVSEIAKKAGSPRRWCEFYYLLTKMSRAQSVLEIGTNLGISGQYFIEGLKSQPTHSKFITLEGIPRLCQLATNRFSKLETDKISIEVIQGLYENTFPGIIQSNNKFDLVFIDGNHQYEPTLAYFNQLKNNFSNHTIILFDDINWSEDMQKAWHKIKDDSYVHCTIDMYKLGLVLVNMEKSSQKKVHTKLFLAR